MSAGEASSGKFDTARILVSTRRKRRTQPLTRPPIRSMTGGFLIKVAKSNCPDAPADPYALETEELRGSILISTVINDFTTKTPTNI